ncbi:hypothetical protein RJT34_03417 [Clitoria ternatea]|uniref:Uncharacterized protein n=1 Tax=Clitoria ternatea TaxID=43366 RepID=A0AAN9Q179_CLITE
MGEISERYSTWSKEVHNLAQLQQRFQRMSCLLFCELPSLPIPFHTCPTTPSKQSVGIVQTGFKNVLQRHQVIEGVTGRKIGMMLSVNDTFELEQEFGPG